MANPIIFGKYHLIDRISAGGMAEVFRAKSYGVAGFEKIIVIKKILPHLSKDSEFIDMFLDEARISVSLSHANIVQVIDLGKEGESYFMAMEYVHGQDLSRTIVQGRKTEPLGLARCLFIVAEVLKGLDYAHRRKSRDYQDLNIVHCDVSPQNILLSYEGEVKLTDFGISRAAFQSASSRGVVRGKYAYMSPEQVEGKELDRRSDIFSMGIILHELLSGKRLFKRDSVDKTLRAVVGAQVPSLSETNPEVDANLERIVMRSLARDRDDRYTDAAEMLDELSSYMFSRGIHVTSTDLSSLLHRIFVKDLKTRRDPMEVGGSSLRPFRPPDAIDGDSTRSATSTTIFIPAGSGHSVPTYQHREIGEQPLILVRLNAVVMAIEWYPAEGVDSNEVEKLERTIHERFEDRIRAMHGDLWEVNHNGLIAVWLIEDDPGGAVAEALECALAIRGEELQAAEGERSGRVALVQSIHAGSVLLEREAARPLVGWQLSRTFALPRLLTNQLAPSPQLIVTEAVRELASSRFAFEAAPTMGQSRQIPPLFSLEGRSEPGGGARVPWSPVTRVLGQRDRVRLLEAKLKDVERGSPIVLLLVGEEGSGRGRSRDAIQLAARRGGVASFSCHGDRDSRDIAYGSITDLLRKVVGLQPDEGGSSANQKLARLAQLGLGPDGVGLIASLFDESPVPEEERARRPAQIREAVDKIVAGLCRDRPLVLFFEEVGAFDELSLGVLKHLYSQLGRRRLMIVVTCDESADVQWLQSGRVQRLGSEGLSLQLVRALASDMLAVGEVEPRLVKELHRRGQGHPLWIKEMVAELADSGAVEVDDRRASMRGRRWPLPDALRDLLQRRLRWLPDRTRVLLGTVAYLGLEFSLIGAEWLVGREGNVRQRLQPAIDVGILQERQVGQSVFFRFQHTAYRELARSGLSAELRTEVPRQLADMLRNHPDYMRGRRTEMMAKATRQAGTTDSPTWLEAAGDKLMDERGLEPALRWYSFALEVVQDAARARAIRRKMARALEQQGHHEEADALLNRILASARSEGATIEVADVELELGRLLQRHGRLRKSAEHLKLAAETATQLGNQEIRVLAGRELGLCMMKLGKLDAASTYVKEAYAKARELGDPILLVKAATAVGFFSMRVGDYRHALESYRRCFTTAKDLNSRELILEALTGIGVVYHHTDQLEQAYKAYKEALGLAQELGDAVARAQLLSRIGGLYAEQGRLERAEHALQMGAAAARAVGQPETRLFAEIHLAWVKATRGDVKGGIAELKAVVSEARERSMGFLVAGGTYYLGRCFKLAGQEEAARGALGQALKLSRTLKENRIARLASSALG